MTTEFNRTIRTHAQLFDVRGRAVIGTTLEGEIVYWSDFATVLFGWERSAVMGRNVVDVTTPGPNQAMATEIMESLRSGNPWSGKFSVRRPDGITVDVHVTDVPVRDEIGKLIGIVGVSTVDSSTPE